MKVALVCRSDSTGGAAVVTFRLMNALRAKGVDTRMIVTEKKSDSPFVIEYLPEWQVKKAFLIERLKIFLHNGMNRDTLFKIDTASDGLPLWKIPFIREADVICLNWVNQGTLSLRGIRHLADLGKPLIWTMHDMWNLTGICHHAGSCRHFTDGSHCADCPLLNPASDALARTTWNRKRKLYASVPIHFVAVSNWLADKARESDLLRGADISVIPNAFPVSGSAIPAEIHPEEGVSDDSQHPIRIIFGAARIDDPVKDHKALVAATRILAREYPELSEHLELVTFGSLKNPDALKDIGIKHIHSGKISPDRLPGVYANGDIVVSTSVWETLPGTLIEGQAWGCIPVAFDHGGQSDIIDHKRTGFLVPWSDNAETRARELAEGIVWAAAHRRQLSEAMHKSVCDRFSAEAVARNYVSLFDRCRKQRPG